MRHPLRLLAIVLLTPAALPAADPFGAFSPTKDPVSPAGVRAAVDLPPELHMRNTGGSDGAGLCVFTAAELAESRWAGGGSLAGFQRWMTRRPGGGWPEKLAAMIREYCRETGRPVPRYVQHTGGDPAFLDLAVRTRRMAAVTYAGADDFYGGTIAHMVDLAHLDGETGAVIDNNRAGSFVWAGRTQIVNRWKGLDDAGRPLRVWTRRGPVPVGGGWAVVFLGPPPPPGVGVPRPTPTPKPAPTPDPFSPSPCPGPNCPKRPAPCPGPGPCPAPRAPRWERVDLHGGEVLHKLFDGGRFLGVWDARGWHPATPSGGWLAAPEGEPPVPPPGVNYGVAFDRIDQDRPRYWVGEVEVTREVAMEVMAEPDGLADDSDRYHLTAVVQTAVAREKVRAVLAADPRAARCHVQVYTAADWAAARVGPGLTVQTPARRGGAVVFRAADWTAADLAEALNYTDPDYRPVAPGPRPVTPVAPAPRPKAPDVAPAPGPKCPACPCPDCPGCPACPRCPSDPPAPAAPAEEGGLAGLLALVLSYLTRRWFGG